MRGSFRHDILDLKSRGQIVLSVHKGDHAKNAALATIV
jgi:hypothetical protein